MPRDRARGHSLSSHIGRAGLDGRWRQFGHRLMASSVLGIACYLVATAAASGQPYSGTGRVAAVDPGRGTITLDHDAIAGLMPAMRMQFAADSALLQNVRTGETVRFTLDTRDSQLVIVALVTAEARPSGQANFKAPDFKAATVAGAPFRLAELRGRAILLNFWATWCVSCRTEMPSLETLYRKYRDRGLEVVAVNLDVLSTAGVEEFLKQVPISFQIALDPSWSAARSYGVVGLPTTFLIDRHGSVVAREVGARDWADALSESAVKQLLD